MNALVPIGQHAYARRAVYCSDGDACLDSQIASRVGSIADSETDAWLPGCRNEVGFLFGEILSRSGELLDNRPGIGTQNRSNGSPPVRSLFFRRKHYGAQLKADQDALRQSGLEHLEELEWTSRVQRLVHPEVLLGLLPRIICDTFECTFHRLEPLPIRKSRFHPATCVWFPVQSGRVATRSCGATRRTNS